MTTSKNRYAIYFIWTAIGDEFTGFNEVLKERLVLTRYFLNKEFQKRALFECTTRNEEEPPLQLLMVKGERIYSGQHAKRIQRQRARGLNKFYARCLMEGVNPF